MGADFENRPHVPRAPSEHPIYGLDVVYSLNWITSKIAIGNFACATDAEFIKQAGINSLVAVAESARPSAKVSDSLIAYSAANLEDGPNNDPQIFSRIVNDLAEMVKYAAPVLVCCHAGRSRSPAVVAAYLVKHEHLTAERAFALIQEQRIICVAPELIQLVRQMEQ